MKTTKQDFLDNVRDLLQQCYATDPGTHKTLDNFVRWTAAYFMAETHEMNTREMATMYLDGIKGITTLEQAMEFWDDEYEMAENDEAAGGNGEDLIEVNYIRLRKWVKPNNR